VDIVAVEDCRAPGHRAPGAALFEVHSAASDMAVCPYLLVHCNMMMKLAAQ